MALRTGADYLESIQDGRQVYVDGESISHVADDPRFAGGAQTTAELYDLQNRSDLIDEMSYVDADTGERVALSYIEPRTVDDLVRRGKAMKYGMDSVFGMFGRSPDFLNVTIAALGSAHTVFDEGKNGKGFGENVRKYYEYVRDNDLTLTHILVNPQVDRSKPIHAQDKDLAVKAIKETDGGFYVNGARLVGTLAQLANEIVLLPSAIVPNDPAALDYSLGFAIPVATEGLKIISRPSLAPQSAGHYLDSPLSARFDEGDAVVIFDNVFIPWERTFIYRDPEMNNALYQRTFTTGHASHQSMMRSLSKAEFMAGLACYMAKAIGADGFLNVAGMLSDLLIYVETQKALIYSAERNPFETPFDTVVPNRLSLSAAQLHFYEKFDEMIDAVRTIGAGSIVGVPSYAELDGPAADYAEHYYQSAGLDSEKRIRLFRLAADVCMSGFSGRQQLYERYYQGDPVRAKMRYYNTFPKDGLTANIEAALDDMLKRSQQA